MELIFIGEINVHMEDNEYFLDKMLYGVSNQDTSIMGLLTVIIATIELLNIQNIREDTDFKQFRKRIYDVMYIIAV